MTKAPISLQDLRRSLYVKAKAEPSWRFWGLYVHVCKMETLREAYRMARSNGGAPGIDGVTFEAIEESGAESFLGQIREELVTNTYRPMRARKKEIPKDGGKVRVQVASETHRAVNIVSKIYTLPAKRCIGVKCIPIASGTAAQFPFFPYGRLRRSGDCLVANCTRRLEEGVWPSPLRVRAPHSSCESLESFSVAVHR